MKKNLFVLLFFTILTTNLFSQNGVSINATGTPSDPSAMLDISSTSKGLLIPRVFLQSITDSTTILSPAISLLVFNTNPSMTGGMIGYWYWSGLSWIQALGPQGATGPTGSTGPQGNTGPIGSGFVHYIGELFGGGIIVYVWKESGNEKGIIASLTDLNSSYSWSNITTTLIGVSAESPIDGQTNTNSIISQPGHLTSAAKLCDDYISGGYSDWYLPSQWELALCAQSAFVVNSILGPTDGFQYAGYFSSTELSANEVWCHNFTLSYTYFCSQKSSLHHVRAIRRF